MVLKPDEKGVSPILAILLMIAITLMIAGIVTLWVFSFLNEEHEAGDFYLFQVDLNATNDTISVTVTNGDIVDTLDLKVIIDENEIPVGAGPLITGSPYYLNCGFDVIKSQSYDIKIVNNNKMIFEKNCIAI